MPRQKGDHGEYIVPRLNLESYTVVVDRARHETVMLIEGVVIMPIGSTIELSEPNVDATVIGVRLLAGSKRVPVCVCLDVEVPESYWSDADSEEARPVVRRPLTA